MTKARSNAVAEAAKGDLSVGTGTNLAGILAIGSNGDTLVADSSTSTGLRYTAGNVSDNPVLNSSYQVWQRGTSFAIPVSTITYTADRWAAYRNATGMTVSRQATNDTTNLPFIEYCARIARNSGNTSTDAIAYGQSWESVNSIPFAGKTVTFSFYARKGANFSGAGIDFVLMSGTGTNQNYINGFTGATNVAVVATALSTTWTRYTATGTVSANATQLVTYFSYYGPTGTAGAADYYEVTGVQVDVGSVALPYRSTTGTIQGELAACQRYYFRTTASAVYSSLTLTGQANTTQIADCMLPAPVTMRTYPTSVDYANIALSDEVAGSYSGGTLSISGSVYSNQFIPIRYTHTSAALTTYRVYKIIANNNSSAYVGVSAEL